MKKRLTPGESILRGLQQALDFENGKGTARVRRIPAPGVVEVRQKTGMTQKEFCEAFDIPLPTLRKWEQGKRIPRGAAGALLRIIHSNPKAAMRALRTDSTART